MLKYGTGILFIILFLMGFSLFLGAIGMEVVLPLIEYIKN
jgi:hypothetical protein